MVKSPPANAGDEVLITGSGKIPEEGKRQPTPVFLPGKSYGQRSPEGAGVWGSQKRHDLAIKQQQSTRIIKFTILSLQCDEFQ